MPFGRRASLLVLSALTMLSAGAWAREHQVVPVALTLVPLFPPSILHGVHGLAFDNDGQLLAAESWGMAVHRIDPRTGRFSTLIAAPDGASDDVGVIGKGQPFAGTIVWSANFEGEVRALDPDGKRRVLASNLPGINTIIVAPDGRLFATQLGKTDALLQIDPAGIQPPRTVLAPSGGLNGSSITVDGRLFGPQQNEDLHRIIELKLDSGDLRVVANDFAWPTGVKRSASGDLYAVDLGTGGVFRLDAITGAKTPIAQFEPGLDNLAIAPDGHLFVSHIASSSIFEIDPGTLSIRKVTGGQFGVPGGLACVRENGRDLLYLADVFTIKRIDASSGAITTLLPLDRRSPFPTNITAHQDHLIVSSLFTGSVQVLDRHSGARLRALAGFQGPHDAVELDDGRIVVAERGARRLTVVDAADQRKPLLELAEDFAGLASDGSSQLYVGASSSGTIYRIDARRSLSRIVARGVAGPEGIAIAADGGLLTLATASHSVQRVDIRNGQQQTIVREAPLGLGAPASLPPSRLFHGLAAGNCSSAYLSSDRDGTIYRLANKGTGSAPARN